MRQQLLLGHRISLAILSVCGSMAVAGCGADGKIQAVFDRTGGADFGKSQILVGSPAAADGHSEVLVGIQLTNTNGTPVKFFKPTYEIVSGTGVSGMPCTTSDANGVSTCLMKATVAGTKRLSVNNIKILLQSDIVFTHPVAKPIYEVVSASKTASASGYKLSGSVGGVGPATVNRSLGYTLFGGVEGVKASNP